jgi:hypothetical protein
MTAVASDDSRVEDPVHAKLLTPIRVDGATVIPAGAVFGGSVVSAVRSGRVKGRASVGFRFDRVTLHNERYEIKTDRVSRVARATKRNDATRVGIGAGAGALVGAIAGGGKGAAIGSVVGGSAGTGVVLATRGDDVRTAVE